jgi:hypothetical protein
MKTEYYEEINSRINNGIKKLQEMDKRLAAYDNREQESRRASQGGDNYRESPKRK